MSKAKKEAPAKKRAWTKEETDRLLDLYETTPVPELSVVLGRSEVAIANYASRLGLKKSSENRRDSISRGRTRLYRRVADADMVARKAIESIDAGAVVEARRMLAAFLGQA